MTLVHYDTCAENRLKLRLHLTRPQDLGGDSGEEFS
jgi:hypothetical protein